MIKFKANAFSTQEIERKVEGKVLLISVFADYCNEYKVHKDIEDSVVIYVNGLNIEKEFWNSITCSESDSVLVTMVPRGGSFRNTLRVIIPTALAIAGAYAGSLVGAPTVGAQAGAAIGSIIGGVVGTILTNNYLPPISPNLNLGGFADGAEESQMYSLQSQNNKTSKYGGIPKVYGYHRFYPYIAANPYVTLEPDPSTGELAQYLYLIYDFGYGPAVISDLKIGNNPFNNYTEISYRLVDLNKPLVSEGFWDDNLNSSFEIYKGDNIIDSVGVSLNGNQNVGGPASNYSITRNASESFDGSEQEIAVDFIAPSGLISFSTDGTRGTSTINLKVEYAPVNTEDWKNFDDPSSSKDWNSTSGYLPLTYSVSPYSTLEVDVVSNNINSPSGIKHYDVLTSVTQAFPGYLPFADFFNFEIGFNGTMAGPYVTVQLRNPNTNNLQNYQVAATPWLYTSVGYQAGRTNIVLQNDIPVETTLKYGDVVLGVVQSKVSLGGGAYQYNLYSPIPTSVELFQCMRIFTDYSGSLRWEAYPAGRLTPDQAYGDYYILAWNKYLGTVEPNNGAINVTNKLRYVTQSVGAIPFSGNTQRSLYTTVRFKPLNANLQYKVRITRVSTIDQYSYQSFNDLQVLSVTTKFLREPIKTLKRHVFMEMRIKATNQINGNLDSVSALVQSVLNVYNGASWEKQVTNNPAWIYADIITGQINKRALDLTRLDTDSLEDWADYCEEVPPSAPNRDYTFQRFQSNFVFDFSDTVQGLINKVTLSAQAGINIIDGNYGVLVDRLKTVPVQIFTPRNSSGFSSVRRYADMPHGFRVKFVDPKSNWELNETIVYTDGYDDTNATVFEDLDTFGCTNEEQAYRFGRFMYAQAKLRQENITIQVDFENLVCTRGDYVKFSHDVMQAGGTPARVKTVSGNQITIDDAVVTVPGSYGYTFRSATGSIQTDTLTVDNSTTFTLDGPIPAVGDLIIIGLVNSITMDCLVKSITPLDDFAATIVLVEKADAVYDAESEENIPDYTPNLAPNTNTDLVAPDSIRSLTVEENTYRCNGTAYQYYIDLEWLTPVFGAVDTYEIYVNIDNRGYGLWDYSSSTDYRYIVNEDNLDLAHSFKILAVAANGKKINLADTTEEVSATPLTKTVPPSDVPSLFINVTNEVLQLNWQRPTDCDIQEYLIRYVPVTAGATWETSSPLLRVDRNTSMATTQSRIGTYLIKAVDFNGNESVVAAQAITAIPELVGLNIIDELTDFPTLPGNMDSVETLGGGIVLKVLNAGPPEEYYAQGYYYFSNLLDLGEIYQVRLQALIQAEGFTTSDLMSEWVTLDSVLALSNSAFDQWAVDLEYRTTESLNVMSEWTLLSDVSAMSTGDDDEWTPWAEFTIGDFVGRIFQFRLKLSSLLPSVTPRVFEAIVRADMPDRTESGANISAPDTGYTVTYSVPFAGPGTSPAIAITQDNASQGDYYLITARTLAGFTITFYDSGSNPVARTFDYFAKGYGYKYNFIP